MLLASWDSFGNPTVVQLLLAFLHFLFLCVPLIPSSCASCFLDSIVHFSSLNLPLFSLFGHHQPPTRTVFVGFGVCRWYLPSYLHYLAFAVLLPLLIFPLGLNFSSPLLKVAPPPNTSACSLCCFSHPAQHSFPLSSLDSHLFQK